MKPKFDIDSGWGAVLLCPQCGGECLHHDKVEVFERCEDMGGLHITVTDKVETDRDLDENPSCRRHGLKIHFWCEFCNAIPVLSIAQHKGSTCVDFKYTEGAEAGDEVDKQPLHGSPEDLELRRELNAVIEALNSKK